MLTPAELNEAQYNARDTLGMCRVYPHLADAVEAADVANVYEIDEFLADLALQMTRIGMPVNSARRQEIGDRLKALRDSSIDILRPYTEGEHREEFLLWVAKFFATKARKGEPIENSVRIGPTRAKAALDELLEGQKQWREFKKLNKDRPEIVAEADAGLAEYAEAIKAAKLDLKAALLDDDQFDGLTHTAESAYDQRVKIRLADAMLATEKKGVNYGAKVQQCAILRTAGVPLTKLTKSGLPQIDKEVLEQFKRHESAKALLKYILTDKTISVYIEGEKRAGKSGGKSKPVMVTEDGYIHPVWSIHKITGRWGSSPNCFDPETEILTHEGWKRFVDLNESDLVAQYWPESCGIDFVRPLAHIALDFDGELYHFKNKRFDLLVTPDHRMPFRRDASGEWCEKLAKDLRPCEARVPGSGVFTFGSVKKSAPWLSLFCAAQADGTWNTSGWDFKGFTRPRKIQRMRRILGELGLEYSEYERQEANPFKPGTKRRRVGFYVKRCAVGDEVHELLGPDKSFGSWMLDWHQTTVDAFLDEIMFWDGSYTRGDCYSSSNRENADWVQILTILSGARAKVRSYVGSSVQKKVNWQVDINLRPDTGLHNVEIATVPYAGKVYCVTVPSSYIVVRRNGQATVAAQCQNWSKRAGGGEENLRTMIEAPEGYIFVGADQAQLEARLVGAMSQCRYFLDTFRAGGDIHGAFAAVGFPADWPRLAAAFKAHKGTVGKGPDGKPLKCTCPQCLERDKMRDLTKRLEYGCIYGGQAKAIWESLVGDYGTLTQRQVQFFLDNFAKECWEVVVWRQQVLKEAIDQGEVRSPILGRRQVFPLHRVDPTVAYNYKAQSGGADLWALGAVEFCNRWDQYDSVDARIIHNGHDSVLIMCKEELAPQVEQDVYACWNREWGGVQFFMEAKIAKRWSET